ncbi:MAG: VCBS repeat-containing protein, partial [Desulfobacterales bacterium]|nr:VCBS repeat-containing protein [Desulfobacterales bacterium]
MSNHSRIGLVMAGCLAVLLVLGCAQHKAYEAPPTKPRAIGLVVAGKFRAVVIEDMDNDGNLDVVGGASSPGMVTISYGDGKGALSEAQILPVHGEVRSVAVADFNEDGLNDIVFTAQRETSGLRLWINQSKRKWKQQNGPIKINKYLSVKTADVNADGHMDIIAANSTEDHKAGIQVWLGNGKGGWIVESGPTTLGRYMDVEVADVNKDGLPDLIGAGWGLRGSVRVWLGDGTGKWTSTSPLIRGSYYGVSTGDLNGDGKLDILAASYQSGIHSFQGDGQGNFEKIFGPIEYLKRRKRVDSTRGKAKYPLSGSPSFWIALPVDLDGDNMLDIVASSLDSKGILAWRNKGNNIWAKIEDRFPSDGKYYGIARADLNADGDLDICAANYGEGIQIWPGKAGKTIRARQMEIEQLPSVDRLAVLAAPIENEVFATIDGIVEYKIGPGDVLEITYWEGSTPTKEEILVHADGKISFSLVEDVPAKGLTASQLDDLLTKRLQRYVRKPRIDVVVKEFNSKTVTLLGAIAYRNIRGTGPGEYTLSGKTTLLELITKAGGPLEEGDLQSINIRRKSGESISVNLFEAIHQGDPGKDFVLDDKDVIFIPTLAKDGNRIYVFGEVAEPGVYSFNDPAIRLADVIAEAGGPTVFATESSTKIIRGDITKPEIISADLESLLESGDQSQNVALVAGDLVYVPRSFIGDVNRFA